MAMSEQEYQKELKRIQERKNTVPTSSSSSGGRNPIVARALANIEKDNVDKNSAEQTVTSSNKELSTPVEVTKGVAKGALETTKSSSDLINTISRFIPQTVKNSIKRQATPGSPLYTLAVGLGLASKVSGAISSAEDKLGLEEGTLTTPTNTAQKVGYYGEKVGEFLVPLGAGAKIVKAKVISSIAGKTEKEILAVALEDVSKLPLKEQKVWFKYAKDEVSKETKQALSEIELKNAQKEAALATEKINLAKELNTTARDTTLSVREKARTLMSEQSKQYRALVEKELAGKENVKVKTTKLGEYVDSVFGENVARADSVKMKLGISEKVSPLSSGVVGDSVKTGIKREKTIGELYNSMKDLKSGINKKSIFTAEDKLTDDSINILTSYLKKEGVDLKEANQFWSKYAPIRNQMIKEVKPFVQSGTQTKTFSSTLKRVAQGKDVDNEIFVKELERMFGDKFSKDVRKVVAKLSENEKATLASKVARQEEIIEAKMLKDIKLAQLSAEQFAIERASRLRRWMKASLKLGAKGALIIGGYTGASNYLGK